MKTREGVAWQAQVERLELEGWEVACRRVWLVEARRGTHIEQAFAPTREVALGEVCQMTLLDGVEGCP